MKFQSGDRALLVHNILVISTCYAGNRKRNILNWGLVFSCEETTEENIAKGKRYFEKVLKDVSANPSKTETAAPLLKNVIDFLEQSLK